MKKIKILRIINRFNLGGPTYNAAYLTKYMPEEYETLLIGGIPEKHETDSLHIVKSLGIEPILIPEMSRSISIYNDFKAYFHIRKYIQHFQPDIVHTHASKAGLLGRLAAIHTNVRIIVHTFHGHIFHSYFHPFLTEIFLHTERYLAKRTSKLIAISPLQKQELTEYFRVADDKKFVMIPLGLDLQKFSEEKQSKRLLFRKMHNLPETLVVIAIVGRLAPVKNHTLILDAIKLLKKKSEKKFELLIIGDGELKNELINYAQQLGLQYRTHANQAPADVYFTSWIKEMDKAYAGTDIVALCSKNEGTPVSLLEAQASAKFIVSTNVGGVKDIVHPNSGIIVPDFSAETLANALNTAIDQFEVQNQNIEKYISPSIIQQYSYHTLVQNMDKLYKKLLGKE